MSFTRYDFNKIRQGFDISVRDLINELEKLNQEAKVTICGDSKFYIHVSEDDLIVSLDYEVESDWYYDNDGNGYFGNKEDIPIIEPIIFDKNKCLYNVIGIDDLEGTTFARCTTFDKSVAAKEIIENEGFEDMVEIVQDEMAVDVIEINGELINL